MVRCREGAVCNFGCLGASWCACSGAHALWVSEQMAGFDPDVWLGGEASAGGSKPLKLGDRLKSNLGKGYETDLWTDDVPEDVLDDAEMDDALKLWKTVVDDSAKANKSTPYSSDFVRFSKWFTALYGEEAETVGNGTTSSKVVVTSEMRADLDKQGMSGPLDLFGFELARYLGRAVAPPELEGAAYGTPPTHMKGAIREAKVSKKAGRATNLDEILGKALETGDPSGIAKHYADLSNRLTSSNSMEFNAKAANLALSFYNKARNTIRDDLAFILYMCDIQIEYMGRGLPLAKSFDGDLAMAAKDKAEEMRAKGTAPGAAAVALADISAGVKTATLSSISGTGSMVGSSVSGSASTAATNQIGEVLAAVMSLQSSVTSMSSRLEDLESKRSSGVPPGLTCFKCGGNHRIADCPVEKAEKAEKEKARKAAAELAASKKADK